MKTTYMHVATGTELSEEQVKSIFGQDLSGLFAPETDENSEIFENLTEN